MTICDMRTACWIPMATYTHSVYVALIFTWKNGCTNAPQCYVVLIVPVLLNLAKYSTNKNFVRVAVQYRVYLLVTIDL